MGTPRFIRLLFAGTLIGFWSAIPAKADPPAAAKIANDVYTLASDDFEGRGIGSKGLEKAGDYIAARFKALGLHELPGLPSYFETFDVNGISSIDPATKFQVNGQKEEFQRNFSPLGISAQGDFAGPVVFAGYGISSGQYNYDDFAGIDVKGKVVMVLRYEPHDEKGRSRFTHADWTTNAQLMDKASAAASHGAVAILLVNPPQFHGPDILVSITRGVKTAIPMIYIRQIVADDLLAHGGSKSNLEALQREIDSSGKPQSVELKNQTISGSVVIKGGSVATRNVLGYIPGTKFPDEFIVVGAHYDHLGHGGSGSLAPGSKEIHHGADDNASGTAAVLALAEYFSHAAPEERSIVFALFSGEEEGLLGSSYLVKHPPLPLDHVVAMLNLDMVGRVRNEVLYVGGNGTADAFDSILDTADAASPLQLKSIGKGGRGPSDHQSFSSKHIPVLFFFSGMHADYHTPTDLPERINFQGMSEVVDLSRDVVDRLIHMKQQPYVDKFDAEPVILGGAGSGGTQVSLGVLPDFGTDESTNGVKITGIDPGSPADAAGLKASDIIVQLGNKKIENLYDLSEFLASAKAADKVPIGYLRGGKRSETTATLVERKN